MIPGTVEIQIKVRTAASGSAVVKNVNIDKTQWEEMDNLDRSVLIQKLAQRMITVTFKEFESEK